MGPSQADRQAFKTGPTHNSDTRFFKTVSACRAGSDAMGTGPCSCQLVSCTSIGWPKGVPPDGRVVWNRTAPGSANGSCPRVTRNLRRDRAAGIKSEARQ